MSSQPQPMTPETVNQTVKVDSKLREMLLGEQGTLYDYSMRMSGNMARSKEAAEHSLRFILQRFDSQTPYPIVRRELFKILRSYNHDIWNADTSNLENPAVNNWQAKEGLFKKNEGQSLDRFMHRLPASDREIVLLKSRYLFVFSDVENILQNQDPVETIYKKTLAELSMMVSKQPEITASIINQIPSYDLPPETKFHTQALSDLMVDMQGRKSIFNPNYILLTLAFLTLLFIAIWMIKDYV